MGDPPSKADRIAAYRWKPGASPNPGGKPKGARNRIQANFLNALADDFEQHGKQAIEACRTQDPSAYVRAIVALMPKELEISRPLDDLSDDELAAALATVRAIEAAAAAGNGAGGEAGAQPAAGLSPVPEAS